MTAMTTATTAAPKLSKVERAELKLRDAVKAGKSKAAVDRLHERLEAARHEEQQRSRRDAEVRLIEKAAAADLRAEEHARRTTAALAIHDELRPHAPVVVLKYAGREVAVDLGSLEPVDRSTAIESVRRMTYTAAEHFRDLTARAMQQLARPYVPLDDSWLPLILGNESGGVRQAVLRGLVHVDGHRVGADEEEDEDLEAEA